MRGRRLQGALRAVTLKRFAIFVAIAYPAALVVVILALRLVGEQWWLTLIAMYLPRWGYGLLLPFVVAVVWRWAPRRALAGPALALLLVLFPLMGLETNLLRGGTGDEPLRILSYNIFRGRLSVDEIARQIDQLDPTIVVLQEAYGRRVEGLTARFAQWHTHSHDQFFLASKHAIREVVIPPKLDELPKARTARYVRYTLETPVGLVDVFNVHPISPRDGFEEMRGDGLTYELRSGRIFESRSRATIDPNTHLRRRQIEAVASAARASSNAVIVAGDTNLPSLSWLLARALGDLQDGFDDAGRGFGYTYPAKMPWMRIDRIMASHHLRFTRFETGTLRGSDHLCVFAALGPRR